MSSAASRRVVCLSTKDRENGGIDAPFSFAENDCTSQFSTWLAVALKSLKSLFSLLFSIFVKLIFAIQFGTSLEFHFCSFFVLLNNRYDRYIDTDWKKLIKREKNLCSERVSLLDSFVIGEIKSILSLFRHFFSRRTVCRFCALFCANVAIFSLERKPSKDATPSMTRAFFQQRDRVIASDERDSPPLNSPDE